MSKEAMKRATELNRYFTSMNGVDVPERVSVPRDEWRSLFAALAEQPAQQEPVEVQMRVGSSYWAKVERNTPAEQLAKAQQLMQDYPGVYEMRTLYTSHSRRRTHEQTN